MPEEIDSNTYSFKPWVAERAKRLRLWRRVANVAPFFVVWLVLTAVMGQLFPNAALLISLMFLVGAIAGLMLVPAFVSLAGFHFGLLKCPACEKRFASPFPLPWVPRACENCRFDIYRAPRR